jgi:hypothetical protein
MMDYDVTIERVYWISTDLVLQDMRTKDLFKILLNLSSTVLTSPMNQRNISLSVERMVAKCRFHSANVILSAVDFDRGPNLLG